MTVMRLKGIKIVRSKGRVYHYHRATMRRLREPFGSAAFVAEVAALDALAAGRADKALPHQPGSLGLLMARYRASPEFTELATRTKADYGKVFNFLAKLDDMPLAAIDQPFVIGLRDKAFAKHKRRFANYVVQVMRLLLSWGAARGHVSENVAKGVPAVRRPRDTAKQNRAWSDAEVAAVLKAASPRMRVAIALGLYAGMREGDAIRFPKSGYDGAWLRWRQGKTGDPVEVPAHSGLKAILAEAMATNSTLMVIGERGRPFTTESGFRAVFFRFIRKLVDEGKTAPGLTYHGLRHTAGTRLAEAGADPRMIQAILGHRTMAMSVQYSDDVNRRRMASAAIVKLERKEAGVGKRKRTGAEN